MRKVIMSVMIAAIGIFVLCQTASAGICVPNGNGNGNDSYFSLTGYHFLGPIDEFDFPFDGPSLPDMGFIDFTWIQISSGPGPGVNPGFLKNDWKNNSKKLMNDGFGGNDAEWSFWSMSIFPAFPTDEQQSMLTDERMELMQTALVKYFDYSNGDNDSPSPVPVPTPLLLMASGLVGLVGVRRMSRT